MPPPNSNRNPVRNKPWTSGQEKRKKEEKKKTAAKKEKGWYSAPHQYPTAATAPPTQPPAASQGASAAGSRFVVPRRDGDAEVAPLNSLGAPAGVNPLTAPISASVSAPATVNPPLVPQTAGAPTPLTVSVPASLPATSFYAAPCQIPQPGSSQPAYQLVTQPTVQPAYQQTNQLLHQPSPTHHSAHDSVPSFAHTSLHPAAYYTAPPQLLPQLNPNNLAYPPTNQLPQGALAHSVHHSLPVAFTPFTAPTFNPPISDPSIYQQSQVLATNHTTLPQNPADAEFTFTCPPPILSPPWDIGQHSVRPMHAALKEKRRAHEEASYRRWKASPRYQQLLATVLEAEGMREDALAQMPQDDEEQENRKRRRRTADPVPTGDALFDEAWLRHTFPNPWPAGCTSYRPSAKRTRSSRHDAVPPTPLPERRLAPNLRHSTSRPRLLLCRDPTPPATAPGVSRSPGFPPTLVEQHKAAQAAGTTLKRLSHTQDVYYSQYDPFLGCKVVEYKARPASVLPCSWEVDGCGPREGGGRTAAEVVGRKVLERVGMVTVEKAEGGGGMGRRVLVVAGAVVAVMAAAWTVLGCGGEGSEGGGG